MFVNCGLNILLKISGLKRSTYYYTLSKTNKDMKNQMQSYHEMLEEKRIQQLMSRKGNCLDNSPMENFFGRMKCFMVISMVLKH